jgi:LAO/AO transport system kinase
MEIPDTLAINKCDLPAAKTMLTEVRSVLALDDERDWRVPIVLTDAVRGEGVPELWDALTRHREHLEAGGELEQRRRANLAAEVFAVASARAKARLEEAVTEEPELQRLLAAVQARQLDPLSAVEEILGQVFRIGDGTTRVR